MAEPTIDQRRAAFLLGVHTLPASEIRAWALELGRTVEFDPPMHYPADEPMVISRAFPRKLSNSEED